MHQTYRNLLNAIAKTARPTTLAALLSDLFMAECMDSVTDPEAACAESALMVLKDVLDANVGEEEAMELIENS